MRLFVVFEGGEGAGKSSQAKALWRKLARQSPALLTHEPGGTDLGKSVRRLLKFGKGISPKAELFLFLSARAELVSRVIQPALENGTAVICDRYTYSTVAYQGYGRGLDRDLIHSLNSVATCGLTPDLVVFLDLDSARGLVRKGVTRDRFEHEEIVFHRKVRQGYLEMAAADPDRWLVVDGSLPRAEISELIWQRVQKLLV